MVLDDEARDHQDEPKDGEQPEHGEHSTALTRPTWRPLHGAHTRYALWPERPRWW
jgi:hypothetical protein